MTNPQWYSSKDQRRDNTIFCWLRCLRSWLLRSSPFCSLVTSPSPPPCRHSMGGLGRHLGVMTSYSLPTAGWTRAEHLTQAGPVDSSIGNPKLGLRETKLQSGCFPAKRDIMTETCWQEQFFAPCSAEQRRPICRSGGEEWEGRDQGRPASLTQALGSCFQSNPRPSCISSVVSMKYLYTLITNEV